MPTSNIKNISTIMEVIAKFKDSQSILDIGCGFGKFGVLCRELFDVRFKRINKDDWITTIDALEVWSYYISDLHYYIYDNIVIGDIKHLAKSIKQYDLILLLDVIEHIRKSKGIEVLKDLADKFNKALIISFPISFHSGACNDWENPYEEHRCLWKFRDLVKIFPDVVMVTNTIFYIPQAAND